MASSIPLTTHWLSCLGRRSYSRTLPFDSIPTAKGLPLIGTLWDVIQAGGVSQIHHYIDKRHQQLGPIFREKLGHVEAVWLADPSFYQQVYQNEGACPRPMLPEPWIIFNRIHNYKRGLFFMQGEEWSHYRKILSPLLMKMATLHRHLESLNDVADVLVSQWKGDAKTNSVTHLEKNLYCYFVQGVMCMAFGRTVGLDDEIVHRYIPEMTRHLQGLFESSAKLTLFPPSLASKLRLNVWRRFEESAMNALQIANQLTETCLDRLKENADEDSSGCIVSTLRQQNVSPSDIQRVVADLFLAAADTTSHTTQWVLYLLAQYPEIQERAVKEIEPIKSSDHNVDWQNIPTIKGSVKEALRLYPVAPFLTRFLPNQTAIGGYDIPAQTLVLMSIFSTGRNERFYHDANNFLPERWNRSGPSVNQPSDPFASLPFGHGRRACVGRRLAEAQMYILLCKVLPLFVLQVDNHVEMVMRLLGTVDQQVQLRLRPRL